MHREVSQRERAAMGSSNRLKLGLFGANCSSGRAVTMVPERWSGNWPDCLKLARMADAAGIEFMLPIGRWKGYGGDTDYQGATFETVTWACGLLANTKRLTVFGTVHAPLIAPVIAAKEFVTADHIGEGRFGLNIVCGWNEGEFEMFGATLRDHESRYDYAQEWLDVIKLAWSPQDDFEFAGRFIQAEGRARQAETLWRQRAPLIMNAGASPTGQAFAIRNCDALFSNVSSAISLRRNRAARKERAGTGAARRPRHRRLYRRRRHLPADFAGGGGLLALFDRRERRLGAPSTTSWQCATSLPQPTGRRNSSGCATTRRTAWAACRWSATPTWWRSTWRDWPRPASPASRFRSSTTSTSCRISATRSCRASPA